MSKPQPMMAYDRLEIADDGYFTHEGDYRDEEISADNIRHDLIPDLKRCPYCSTVLLKVEGIEATEDPERLVRDYSLWYCRYCRFWQVRLYFDPYGGCMPGPDNWAFISKLRDFDGKLPDSCSAELASFIRRNPNVLQLYEPRRFEKVVADVFRANFSDAEVLHVGKPDDGGKDVLLIDSDGQQWLIQVKRRESPKRAEGVSTIRNLLGAMVLEGALNGIVVSTANQFSLRARQAVNISGQIGMRVKLVDRGIFNRMLDLALPDRPWLEPISKVDRELARYLSTRVDSDYQLCLFDSQPLRL